jgi:predicted DNA repair protein MutK
MIFSMLFFVTISLVNVYNFAKNKSVSRIILHSFIALVVIVLPSVFESLIYMKIFTLLAYALVIAYVLLGIVYFFVSVRKPKSALL